MKVLSVQTKQLTAENDEQSYEITLFSVGVIWAVNLCVFTIIQKRLSQRFDNKGIADVQVN
jgi:hypothetical protein